MQEIYNNLKGACMHMRNGVHVRKNFHNQLWGERRKFTILSLTFSQVV